MIRSLLVSSDEQINREMMAALQAIPSMELTRVLTAYPAVDELLRVIRVRRIDLVFMCVEELTLVESLAACLDDLMTGLPVIAFSRHSSADLVRRLMHLGIREHLTSPLQPALLAQAIESSTRHLTKHPLPAPRLADLYTFLPAKPGVGTSTIALSVSCALADNLGVRALLLDCDLYAGAIKFLLKLGNSSSILDAIQRAQEMDEDMWSQLVGKWDQLDVLHAGELTPPPSVDLDGLQSVLAMARPQYEVICADLGSSMDPFSVALMRESRRTFLASTSEMVPLYLAADRMRRLTELGLGDRVSLILNRKDRRSKSLGEAEVARIVGIPVTHCLANDYDGVQESILAASPVPRGSALGHSIMDLAQSVAPRAQLKEALHHRKFLEFFHVTHAHESDVVWRD